MILVGMRSGYVIKTSTAIVKHHTFDVPVSRTSLCRNGTLTSRAYVPICNVQYLLKTMILTWMPKTYPTRLTTNWGFSLKLLLYVWYYMYQVSISPYLRGINKSMTYFTHVVICYIGSYKEEMQLSQITPYQQHR